jgi:hypothetical protein
LEVNRVAGARLDHSPWLEKWQSNTEMVQHVQVRQVRNAHQIPFRKAGQAEAGLLHNGD